MAITHPDGWIISSSPLGGNDTNTNTPTKTEPDGWVNAPVTSDRVLTGEDIVARTITAENIKANSITAELIKAGAITADKISVTELSAISADMGTITAGNITIDSAGFIQGGMTGYQTGTGFWLGYDTSAYKFSIGNSTEYMTWDGNSLTIAGDIINIDTSTGAIVGDVTNVISVTSSNAIQSGSCTYSKSNNVVDETNANCNGVLGTALTYATSASRPVSLHNVKQIGTNQWAVCTSDLANDNVSVDLLQFSKSTSTFSSYGTSGFLGDGYESDIDYVTSGTYVLGTRDITTSYPEAYIGTSSGLGSATQFTTTTSSNIGTKVVMLDSTNGILFYYASSTIYAHLFTVSGSTITAGNSTTISVTKTSVTRFLKAKKISSTKAVLTWIEETAGTEYQMASILTFSTPNISAGTVKEFSGSWTADVYQGDVMNIIGDYWIFSGKDIIITEFDTSANTITEISSANIESTYVNSSWLHKLGNYYFILAYWNENDRKYYSRLYFFDSTNETITEQSETALLTRGGTDDTSAQIALMPISPYRVAFFYSQREAPDTSDERLRVSTANISQTAIQKYIGLSNENIANSSSGSVQIGGSATSVTGVVAATRYYVGNGGTLYDLTGENGESIDEDLNLLKVAGIGYKTNSLVMQTFYQNE